MLDPLLAVLGFGYVAAAVWLMVGLRRSASGTPNPATGAGSPPSVAVIVAARNEEAGVSRCLESLRGQTYGGPIEVVLVDDGSSDRTAEVAEQEASLPGVTIRVARAPEPPAWDCRKKSALATGIAATRGELLLFTDADCQPPPAWVASMVASFGDGVGLVAGYASRGSSQGLRGPLVKLDNLMVAALGAGSAGMGASLSCTGRSFAYRRAVYDQVGGFEKIGHLIGGDDVYFARLAAAETEWRLVYNLQPEAAVQSDAGPATWRGLLHQKLRHAAKAAQYRGAARLSGALTYLYHFVLLMGVVKAAAFGHDPAVLVASWGAKWAADAALLSQIGRQVGERPPLGLLPLLEACYIPYVLVFTIAGRLGWFRWKGAPAAA